MINTVSRLNVININFFTSIQAFPSSALSHLRVAPWQSLPLIACTPLAPLHHVVYTLHVAPVLSLTVLEQNLQCLLHHCSRSMGLWHICGICTLFCLVTPSWLCLHKPDPSQVLSAPASTTDPVCDTIVLPLHQEQTPHLKNNQQCQ